MYGLTITQLYSQPSAGSSRPSVDTYNKPTRGFWYMDACLTQFPPHQFAEFSQRGHSPIGCLISGVCQKLARERSIELLKGCESRAQVNIEHGRHNAPAHVNGRPRERACFVLAPEWQKLQDLAVFKMRCSTPLIQKIAEKQAVCTKHD